jgi:transposase-like protein
MPVEIPWETRIDAEDMYITGGMTYEQVAEATGVAVSTIKRWGSDDDWTGRKREYREAQTAIKQKTMQLRLGLIKTAMEEHDPMQVFAAAKFEELELKKEALRPSEAQARPDAPKISVESPGEAVSALQGAIEGKIGRMVAGVDGLDLKTLRDLKGAMELLDGMKQKYNPAAQGEGKKILTAEEIDRILEQIKL